MKSRRLSVTTTRLFECANLTTSSSEMDCVEVSPPYDVSELTVNAASTFVWTYLAGRIARAAR